MSGKILETNNELYCSSCGSQGMKLSATKAESGKRRYVCPACGFRTTRALYTRPQILPPTRVTDIKKHKRFLITSAVNDTPLVTGAHETFKRLADEMDACYLIIPCRYNNPDAMHTGKGGKTWPDEILPYICNAHVRLNKNLIIRGASSINYTAINPLGGMAVVVGTESMIYGSPQVAMEMVATPKPEMPKMLHTTGSISAAEYGLSRQSDKVEGHHSLSAVFIEIEGDSFWPTQVHYDGTGAYLFDRYYTPAGSTPAGQAEAVIYGDIHKRYLTKLNEQQLLDIASIFRPKQRVFHDVHDHHIGSHHTNGNALFALKQSVDGEFSVRSELMQSVAFLEKHDDIAIVESNHHDHLWQWFNRFKPAQDPVNAELYFELGEMARADMVAGGDGNLFRLFLQKYSSKSILFPTANELFLIAGIDCSQHGHRGTNGTKGSAMAFARTSYKTFIADAHTPRIYKGSYQVGVNGDGMPYARGYSSWAKVNGVIYPNGKRALISIVRGKFSPIMRGLIK